MIKTSTKVFRELETKMYSCIQPFKSVDYMHAQNKLIIITISVSLLVIDPKLGPYHQLGI